MENTLEIKYICTGGCGGEVTEEAYKAGKTTCGDPNCLKFGQPFEKRVHCKECGQDAPEEQDHRH